MVGAIKTPGQVCRNVKERGWVLHKKCGSVGNVKLRGRQGEYVRGMRFIEQRGYLAEDHAGFRHLCNLSATLDDAYQAGFENQKPPGFGAVREHGLTRAIACKRECGEPLLPDFGVHWRFPILLPSPMPTVKMPTTYAEMMAIKLEENRRGLRPRVGSKGVKEIKDSRPKRPPDTKADAAVPEVRGAPATEGRAKPLRTVLPGAPRTMWRLQSPPTVHAEPILGCTPVTAIPVIAMHAILDPFINIAMHVVEPKGLSRHGHGSLGLHKGNRRLRHGLYEACHHRSLRLAGKSSRGRGIYPYTEVDSTGQPLSGANEYTLTFAKGQEPPGNSFWSITMYQIDQGWWFVPNALNKFTVSPRNNLKANTDGSVTLYFQNESPGSDKESNWLPAPKGPFLPMMRMYWPQETKPSILDGTWTPPQVMKAN